MKADIVRVNILEIDRQGRVRLSLKEVDKEYFLVPLNKKKGP